MIKLRSQLVGNQVLTTSHVWMAISPEILEQQRVGPRQIESDFVHPSGKGIHPLGPELVRAQLRQSNKYAPSTRDTVSMYGVQILSWRKQFDVYLV